MAHYIDTSALMKLVVDETESLPLVAWLRATNRGPVACDLARTELVRAVRQIEPGAVVKGREVLDAIALLPLTPALYDAAGRLAPDRLRSLDAIHLAAALSLGDDLEGLVTYDERLASAARMNGVSVFAPA